MADGITTAPPSDEDRERVRGMLGKCHVRQHSPDLYLAGCGLHSSKHSGFFYGSLISIE
jgi:hypothetical protein